MTTRIWKWNDLCDPSKAYVLLAGISLLFTLGQLLQAPEEQRMAIGGTLLAGIVGVIIMLWVLQWMCKAGYRQAAYFLAVGLPAALAVIAYMSPQLVAEHKEDPFNPLYARAVRLGEEYSG